MINKIFPKINFPQRPYLFLFCRTRCDLCYSFSSQIEGGLLIKMSNSALLDIDLKENEVHELLKLQSLFHSQYMTEELLNAMIGLYVRFVENIHSNQHPLRIFFMEKIKFVLSRPEIIKILEKDSQESKKNMRETIRGVMGLSYDEEMQMKKLTEEAKQEIRKNHIINMKKEKPGAGVGGVEEAQLKDKERNMKIEMQMKIMEEVEQNMMMMKKEMNREGEQRKKQEAEITNMMQLQDNALNQRLAKRKKKLRKRSVDLKDKEVVVVEAPPPIAKAELIQMKKEVSQTYERFTRLTMSKTKRGSIGAKIEKEGEVKVKIQEAPIYQEDIFDQVDKPQKKQEVPNFSRSKPKVEEVKAEVKVEPQEVKKQEQKNEEVTLDTCIEYKTFDQKQGRVTVRNKVYEQIEDDPFD